MSAKTRRPQDAALEIMRACNRGEEQPTGSRNREKKKKQRKAVEPGGPIILIGPGRRGTSGEVDGIRPKNHGFFMGKRSTNGNRYRKESRNLF